MNNAHRHSQKDPACLDIFERLSEYLDGELSPADCVLLEAHIADCAPCIQFLDSLKASVSASKGFRAADAAAPIPEEVRRRLEAAWHAAVKHQHPR